MGVLVGAFLGLCVFLKAEGGGVAGAVDPCGADVDCFAEAVAEHDAEIVATVVFCRKGFAVVDFLSGEVELTHALAPCVADPSGKVADIALEEQLDAVGPAVSHGHFFFPAFAVAPEGGAILVLDKVVHGLVIAFDGDVADDAAFIKDSAAPLVGLHGLDAVGYRNPEVGGHADAGGG